MANKILVSVLITAYNEEEKIMRCLDSIANQTFKDFEIIIINDGSVDKTDDLIREFISHHDSISYQYVSRCNKGRMISLNEGIKLAKGKYIAIQDADDYSLPNRLEEQVKFLENNITIDVLGTAYIRIDSIRNEKYIRKYPTNDEDIKKEMCKYIPICQGSMMIKTNIISSVGGYNIKCKDAEDLDLWIRLGNNIKFANLSNPYYVYDLTMSNSYFHSNYSVLQRNLRVFILNCKAIKVFNLKKKSYVYALSRLIYPYIPNKVKKIIRKNLSKIDELAYEE